MVERISTKVKKRRIRRKTKGKSLWEGVGSREPEAGRRETEVKGQKTKV